VREGWQLQDAQQLGHQAGAQSAVLRADVLVCASLEQYMCNIS
jgi:hypothetical protein